MSKHLRIWLFVILGTLLATTTLLAQGVITMTTSKAVGEKIKLRVEANGNVTIEGAQETGETDGVNRKSYRLTSQTITIRGDVTELNCMTTQLTSLNVSGCATLTELICDGNQLTSLDVSKNIALTELRCSYNRLTSLDVSKNIALTLLDCCNNKLTSLNLSECTRLVTLYCYSNCINGKAMTKLVNSLSNRRKKKSGTIFLVDRYSERRDKNKYSAAHVATARKKNWEVRQY